VGEPARAYLEGVGGDAEGLWAPDPVAATAVLAELVRPGDRVLVKGSRSAGLEVVPTALAARLERRG
jgi:UDP-N-acetylmuramyl pentapeptide synthase